MIFDKRYFFASSVKNKMLSQMLLLFSFFASYVSPELVAFFHVICFIKTGCFNCCLFLPFKYFVFCGKKWFSTKDISSLLLWGTKCCLRCYFFFSLINSRVSSLGCFFSRHMFPQKWLLFSPHMFHQNWLLFFTSTITTKRQWVSLHVFSFGFHFDLGLSFQSTSISVSISVFSFDFSFSSRSQFQLPVSILLEVDFESSFTDLWIRC